jgi:GTPase SAR1 family protein
VPGQIKYNLTRKAVLKGADAVVFVADSQRQVREADMESFANMKENLLSNNINPDNIVLILQYNKRDLSNILPVDELNKILNSSGYIYLEAEAINGKGVKETFQTVTKLLIKDFSEKYKFDMQPPTQPEEAFTAVSGKIVGQPPSYEETNVPEESAVSSFPQDVLEVTELREPGRPSLPQHETAYMKKDIEEPELPKAMELPAYSPEQIDKLTECLRENTDMLSGIKSAINELLDEFKKSSEDQKEVLAILRGIKINETIEKMKEKEKEKKDRLTK